MLRSLRFARSQARQHLYRANKPCLLSSFATDDMYNSDTEQQAALRRQAQILKEIDEKKGRGFSDPYDLEDMMESKEEYEDLPDWTADLVSRIASERVQVLEKIPSLQELANLSLPLPPPRHPADSAKIYALSRKRMQAQYVKNLVKVASAPYIPGIQKLKTWEEKQDAVDALFEDIEMTLMKQEPVLGKHPQFGKWVETALESHLQEIQRKGDEAENTESSDEILPAFVDCYSSEHDSEETVAPRILCPLDTLPTGQKLGRLMEEWELAAHKTTRRVLLRDCTKQAAQALLDQRRVVVDGVRGVGKTSALAALVASARQDSIVLYIPNGDHFSKNGFYLEPSHREGIYDLPVLSQQVCEQLLTSHKSDLEKLTVSSDIVQEFANKDQLKKLGDGSLSAAAVLEVAVEHTSMAPTCYSIVISALMQQEEVDFVMVADEFNSYFQPSHYFHMDYDPEVKQPIPYQQISLFRPILDAMGLYSDSPKLMKRGGVVAGMSRSRAVADAVNQGMLENAKENGIPVVQVPRLSLLETEHMLANYECIGLGNLRLDQGEVAMNGHEISFLRTVSGGIPQKLMDAVIV